MDNYISCVWLIKGITPPPFVSIDDKNKAMNSSNGNSHSAIDHTKHDCVGFSLRSSSGLPTSVIVNHSVGPSGSNINSTTFARDGQQSAQSEAQNGGTGTNKVFRTNDSPIVMNTTSDIQMIRDHDCKNVISVKSDDEESMTNHPKNNHQTQQKERDTEKHDKEAKSVRLKGKKRSLEQNVEHVTCNNQVQTLLPVSSTEFTNNTSGMPPPTKKPRLMLSTSDEINNSGTTTSSMGNAATLTSSAANGHPQALTNCTTTTGNSMKMQLMLEETRSDGNSLTRNISGTSNSNSGCVECFIRLQWNVTYILIQLLVMFEWDTTVMLHNLIGPHQ
ncbi:hypothetical protein RFI_21458 [Reticulomyxa filosa]|uniref:Uncharacterized protein n=1 Tax=Reticulomyxa filosa TaxID=46433 RepID=X6MS61_RETFI|nr:hypothetical protein RFI_21458 [Reticulomyxa filosa]|eukprot:ETO15905.1 hypothetical protein RFI_21458 [Reticulomyxa filosa]